MEEDKQKPSEGIYQSLSKINLESMTEKTLKGFTYLSWIHAIEEMIKRYGYDFTWTVHEDSEGKPYFKTDWDGAMVKVSTTIHGNTRTQWHPVISHTNKAIQKPDAMAINNAIQRCLAKCIAMHGLGIYLYAGEDLPPTQENPDREPESNENKPQPKTKERIKLDRAGRRDMVKQTIDVAVEKGLGHEEAIMLMTKAASDARIEQKELTDPEKTEEEMFMKVLKHFVALAKKELEKDNK